MRPLPVSYALLVAFAGGIVIAVIDALAGGSLFHSVALGAFALLAALVSLCTRPIAAPAVAMLAWMFDDGFVINHGGDLTWHGAWAAERLAILVAVALAGAAFGARTRPRTGASPPNPGTPETLPPDTASPDGAGDPCDTVLDGSAIPNRPSAAAATAEAGRGPSISRSGGGPGDDRSRRGTLKSTGT